MTIRIAIIGFGKIARDQHLPSILADPEYELVALAGAGLDGDFGVPTFPSHGELLRTLSPALDAVAICTPPQVRHQIARDAIAAGLSVLLEKPPAADLDELIDLENHAAAAGCGLYAAWHCQHAPAIGVAARLIASSPIRHMRIVWREDVRKWHPGQEWIWSPGGFGVFDSGINALSMATALHAQPLEVEAADLLYPSNRQAPIAARMIFADGVASADIGWDHAGPEDWTIDIDTAGHHLVLGNAGAELLVDGAPAALPPSEEYRSIYRAFATVVRDRAVIVDREPLRLVAQAFRKGRRTIGPAFP